MKVAHIRMTNDTGGWFWSFSNWLHGGYTVKSEVGCANASYAIAQATRIAKRNGFDDAKVLTIELSNTAGQRPARNEVTNG